MKFYLASGYSKRDYLRMCAQRLVEHGHEVTSRWLETKWQEVNDQGSSAAPPEYRTKYAVIDMEDVLAADCLIAFSNSLFGSRGNGRGGRHAEFGMAAAAGKQLVLIGDEEHVFHYLPTVKKFTSFGAFLESLKTAASA